MLQILQMKCKCCRDARRAVAMGEALEASYIMAEGAMGQAGRRLGAAGGAFEEGGGPGWDGGREQSKFDGERERDDR